MPAKGEKYFVYILQSRDGGWYYTGYTTDIRTRLEDHNRGASRSTRRRRPWKVVHVEEYVKKRDALRREREIKRMKSRAYICELIKETEKFGA